MSNGNPYHHQISEVPGSPQAHSGSVAQPAPSPQKATPVSERAAQKPNIGHAFELKLNLSDESYDLLEAIAQKYDAPKSTIARMMIIQFLESGCLTLKWK